MALSLNETSIHAKGGQILKDISVFIFVQPAQRHICDFNLFGFVLAGGIPAAVSPLQRFVWRPSRRGEGSHVGGLAQTR